MYDVSYSELPSLITTHCTPTYVNVFCLFSGIGDIMFGSIWFPLTSYFKPEMTSPAISVHEKEIFSSCNRTVPLWLSVCWYVKQQKRLIVHHFEKTSMYVRITCYCFALKIVICFNLLHSTTFWVTIEIFKFGSTINVL